MTVELRLLGAKCNIACRYCYQTSQRKTSAVARGYDLERMKAAALAANTSFTVFGGEPLLVPVRDLEELWAWGLERFGENGIQTNGSLIRDEHVELFRKYKVAVGISIDGPGELNDVRWAGNLAATREATRRSEAAIDRLCREGMPPSLIVTLSRSNATAERLPAMADWFARMDELGVPSARLHQLEVDDARVRASLVLADDEVIEAFEFFHALESDLCLLRFDVFKELRALLTAADVPLTCVWGSCDQLSTQAVHGIEGDGHLSNCGRTYKSGVEYVKATDVGYERYIALHGTRQSDGGCAGCRFFVMCRGQCPGTGIDGDWRNRSEHCDIWKRLFSAEESRLAAAGLVPVSRRADLGELERSLVVGWSEGRNPSVAELVRERAGADVKGGT